MLGLNINKKFSFNGKGPKLGFKVSIDYEIRYTLKKQIKILTFCHMKTLWTIAQPQKIMPSPINTLVITAGVEWNCMNVYNIMPRTINIK